MKELIIFIGIPASGKSTFYIKHYLGSHIHINLDTLKSRSREWALFTTAVAYDSDIVVDNTNINKEKRARYINYVKTRGYTIKCVNFKASAKDCNLRNIGRKAEVPKGVIERFLNDYEEPSHAEGFNHIETIMVDDK